MEKRTFQALGITKTRMKKLMLKGFELMIKAQGNPDKFYELLENDKDLNEKEKLWGAYNGGCAKELSTNKEFKSLDEKDEKLGPIMVDLAETTKTYSEIILKVLKMNELTLREKIVLCFNTGRIIQAFYGPTVPQPPWMNSRFSE